MDYENLCISCFREKDDEICKYCGYIEQENRRKSLLPSRMLLNERYIIGEVVNADKSSIEYKAWDTKENRIVEIQEYYPREVAFRDENGIDVAVIMSENLNVFRKNINSIMSSAKKMMDFSDSPYLVNIYDCFECNNTAYVVKEYLEGTLLSDFISSYGGKVDVETAVSVVVPVLEGLSQLHKAGLVHRAISPKSIIITVDNDVKTGNFRFLKEASPYKDENMTVHFSSGYAPPEQYRTRSKQGAFSDIYSVGAVLYRMLAGRRPADALERTGKDELVPPKTYNKQIPDNVNISIMKAMNMTSELRFKTVADFKNGLLEKKAVVDIDDKLKSVKNENKKRTIIAAAATAAAVIGFALYMILS